MAGGIALNRDRPRISSHIDIFQDDDQQLTAVAEGDGDVLAAGGFAVTWPAARSGGKRQATVGEGGDHTPLEWVADSDIRFFPAQPDDLFGYVLHPADLATNKATASADRRTPRDIVDLLTVHDQILPLGPVISAAVGRFPGMTPEEMLAEIRRHATFTANEFAVLAVEPPLAVRSLQKRIRAMLDDAQAFLERLPSEVVGHLFLDGDTGTPVQPDLADLGRYRLHAGRRRGHWPSSTEIGSAMLERYGDKPA